MDIEDIDEWYEEQKNILTEKYQEKLKKIDASFKIKAIEDDKSPESKEYIKKRRDEISQKHKVHKKEYLKQMKELHREYDTKIKNKLDNNLTRHFRKHNFTMWKKKHLKFLKKFKKEKKKKES